ncbi:hypothetical protein [Bacillus phage BvP]
MVKKGTYKLDKRLTAIVEYRKLIDKLNLKRDPDFPEALRHLAINIGHMFIYRGSPYVIASALTSLSNELFFGAIRITNNTTGQTSDSGYYQLFSTGEVLESKGIGSVVSYYEQLVESLSLIEKREERIEELQNEIDSLRHEVDMQMSINSEALFKARGGYGGEYQ